MGNCKTEDHAVCSNQVPTIPNMLDENSGILSDIMGRVSAIETVIGTPDGAEASEDLANNDMPQNMYQDVRMMGYRLRCINRKLAGIQSVLIR